MEDPFDVQQRVFEKKKNWVKLFSTYIWVLDVLMMKGVSYESGEGKSNFDDKFVKKSVQLVRGSSLPNDLLQNPYFSGLTNMYCFMRMLN